MNTANLRLAWEGANRRWLRCGRRTLLVVTLLMAVGIGVEAAGVQIIAKQQREAKRLEATRDSFLATAMSLDNYNDAHGHLPFPVRCETPGKPTQTGTPNGTGKPLYSWRGEVALYRDSWFFGDSGRTWDASSPWDAPANAQMADFPWQFCYDALVTWEWPKGYSKTTCMMALTGPGTAFGCEGQPPRSLNDIPKNTILVVEVRDSGIHWMQPGDFDIRTMPHTINAADGHGISSRYPGGFHVLFADLRTWFLSDRVPFETLKEFFTIEGAKQHDREQVLGRYALWRPPSRRPLSAHYHLDDMKQLELDAEVSDADLKEFELPQFAQMKTLSLSKTQVAGPGLAHLRSLAHLQTLMLDRTPITDDGLAYVADLRQLTWLRLDNTRITDKGLEHLRPLLNLKRLGLADTQVTDVGLEHVKGLTQLECLTVDNTSITDAGVEHLTGLTRLKTLSLLGTKVSEQGMKRLRQALPQCHIADPHHYPATEKPHSATP